MITLSPAIPICPEATCPIGACGVVQVFCCAVGGRPPGVECGGESVVDNSSNGDLELVILWRCGLAILLLMVTRGRGGVSASEGDIVILDSLAVNANITST